MARLRKHEVSQKVAKGKCEQNQIGKNVAVSAVVVMGTTGEGWCVACTGVPALSSKPCK